MTLARQTIENFLERAIRLYEQEPGEELVPTQLGAYVRRWRRWVAAQALAGCIGNAQAGQFRGSPAVCEATDPFTSRMCCSGPNVIYSIFMVPFILQVSQPSASNTQFSFIDPNVCISFCVWPNEISTSDVKFLIFHMVDDIKFTVPTSSSVSVSSPVSILHVNFIVPSNTPPVHHQWRQC